MSTRSFIAIQQQDGTYDGIYCHFDGYPSGVGDKLEKHYTDRDKILELISGGDISCLHTDVDKCEYYTKRGEPLNVVRGLSKEALVRKAGNMWCEYLYMFTTRWTCRELHDRHDN
jgi:hypothetical protein